MSKTLPNYQRDALLVLRVRLNPDDPANLSSDEIKMHLRAIRGWLDSWVLTAVDVIDSDRNPGTAWLREAIARDARHMRSVAEEVKS